MLHLEQGSTFQRSLYDQDGQLVKKNLKIIKRLYGMEGCELYEAEDLHLCEKVSLRTISKTNLASKDRMMAEIRNHKKMTSYQNFIALYAVYEDSHTIYLLMEVAGSRLCDVLERRGRLMEREVQFLFCQLVDMLDNLRSRNIVHSNITLESIQVCENSGISVFKLGDFSCSTHIEEYEEGLAGTIPSRAPASRQSRSQFSKGSSTSELQSMVHPYLSPEEVQMNVFAHEDRSFQTLLDRDIWHIGIILYRCLCGWMPFHSKDLNEQLNRIKKCALSFSDENDRSLVSQSWCQLIKRILAPKERRIDLRALITHPFHQAFHRLSLSNMSHCVPPPLENHLSVREWGDDKDTALERLIESSCCSNLTTYKKNWELLFTEKYSVSGEIDTSEMSSSQNNFIESDFNNRHKLLLHAIQQRIRSLKQLSNVVSVSEPIMVQKYSYDKEGDCLAYILNKSVGVCFGEGGCIFGPSHTDVIEPYHTLFPMQDEETKIYHRYVDKFGVRVVKGDNLLWVEKFWKDENVYVFLLSSSAWQVIFQSTKASLMVIIDQYELSWVKSIKHDMRYVAIARQIIAEKKRELEVV